MAAPRFSVRMGVDNNRYDVALLQDIYNFTRQNGGIAERLIMDKLMNDKDVLLTEEKKKLEDRLRSLEKENAALKNRVTELERCETLGDRVRSLEQENAELKNAVTEMKCCETVISEIYAIRGSILGISSEILLGDKCQHIRHDILHNRWTYNRSVDGPTEHTPQQSLKTVHERAREVDNSNEIHEEVRILQRKKEELQKDVQSLEQKLVKIDHYVSSCVPALQNLYTHLKNEIEKVLSGRDSLLVDQDHSVEHDGAHINGGDDQAQMLTEQQRRVEVIYRKENLERKKEIDELLINLNQAREEIEDAKRQLEESKNNARGHREEEYRAESIKRSLTPPVTRYL